MFDSKTKTLNNSVSKIKKVKKISLIQKEKLINSVIYDHISIHQASKIHDINYSSAKYIINLFKKMGSLTPQHKKHGRKSKIYIVHLTVLIDQNSGEILLYKQNKLKQQSRCDEIKISLNKGAYLTSKIISETLNNSQMNYIQAQQEKQKIPTYDNLEQLQKIIFNQHEQMQCQ